MYVFDTNILITIFNFYYISTFPSFWENFNEYIENEKIISVRDVLMEIDAYHNVTSDLVIWANQHKNIFYQPNELEMIFVSDIFSITHFQNNIPKESQLVGRPVADPFVIAKAKVNDGYVVTNEEYKKNGAKIPNICDYFKVNCINLNKFMELENWKF